MGQPVPRGPSRTILDRLVVGNPVSAAHGRAWADQLAFLLAHAGAQVIGGNVLPNTAATTPYSVPLFYKRSAATQALLVVVELHPTQNAGTLTLSVTTTSGTALTWIDSAGGRLDASATAYTEYGVAGSPGDYLGDYSVILGVLNATALTVGGIDCLKLNYTRSANAEGVYRYSLVEVPLAAVSPTEDAATEVSFEAAWPHYRPGSPRIGLVDGGTSSPRGLVRAWDQMDKARSQTYRHAQWSLPEHDTYCATVTAGAATAFTWQGACGTYDPVFYIRPRRLYTVSTTNNVYQLYCRYHTDGVASGTLRAVVGGVNVDLALPASATWATAGPATVNVPCGVANAAVDVKFRGWTSDGSALHVAAAGLVENES